MHARFPYAAMVCAPHSYSGLAEPRAGWSNTLMLARRSTFTLSVVLSSGCYGGQSGDPGVNQSPVTPTTGPEVIVPERDCQRTTWQPDEAGPSTHSCEVAGDASGLGEAPVDWSCDCDGTLKASEAARCEDALLDACGIKYTAATYCEFPLATCFPKDEAGDEWLCRCSEDSENPGAEVDAVTANDCWSAAVRACGETCESRVGSCETSKESTTDLECRCSRPFADQMNNTTSSPVFVHGEASCAPSLAQTCGSVCSSETGACTLDETGFACTCNDETSAHIDAEALSEPDGLGLSLCDEATYEACGAIEQADSCSSNTEQWAASCVPRPHLHKPGQEAPSSYTFDCECAGSDRSDDDAGATLDGGAPNNGGGSFVTDAPDCEAAVKATCPGAVRPGSDPNGPTLDYGHTCVEDDDCSGGACYVPGTKVNPICSKHCESNDDCPSFAHCVGGAGGSADGYCFVRCAEDDECLELNPSIGSNPLHCASDFDPDSPKVCWQASEP